MRAAKMLFIVSILVASPGCDMVVSLHPLWSDDVLIDEPTIEGEWVEIDHFGDQTISWRIEHQRKGRYVVRTKNDFVSLMPEVWRVAMLSKIGEAFYLDFEGDEASPNLSPADHTSIPGHSFAMLSAHDQHGLVIDFCGPEEA